MNMKNYIEPEINVIVADDEDILTTSAAVASDDSYAQDIFGFFVS